MSYLFMWETWAIVGALIGAGVVGLYFRPIFEALPLWVRQTIIGVGAILLSILGGRLMGKKSAQQAQAKRDAAAVNTRRKVDESVAKLPDSELDGRINKWMRDDK